MNTSALHFFKGSAAETRAGADIPKVGHSMVVAAAWIAAFFLAGTAVLHLIFLERTADIPVFDLIDVDGEANMPTWLASFLLLSVGMLALAISQHDIPSQRTGWRGIAVIMTLMSMDEVACLHNAPSRRLSEVVGTADGYLTNAWVLPAGVFLVVLACIYLPFFLRLPRWLKRGLIGSAAAYLVGAVGLEIVGSKLEYDAGGLHYDGSVYYSLRFELCAVAEEVFEFIGVLATLHVLIRHASNLKAKLTIGFMADKTSED
ncbi:MAG: hypothetical protein R3F13_13420 [Prosthecobacter sp.]